MVDSERADTDSSVRVSVCIPLYNQAATIERCLRSILVQTAPPWEILIIDDCSSDNGVELARAMLRPCDRIVVNDQNLGAAANHNRCITSARGEVVQFVHGDDELKPRALSMLSAMFVNPDVTLAFAPRTVVTDDALFERLYGTLHTKIPHLRAVNDGSELVEAFVRRGCLGNWIGEPTSVMIRRRRALDVGGFRTDLVQVFDIDLWLRVVWDRKVGFVDEHLSVRNHHAATLSAANLAAARDVFDHPLMVLSIVKSQHVGAGVRLRAAVVFVLSWLLAAFIVATTPAARDRRHLMRWVRLPAARTATRYLPRTTANGQRATVATTPREQRAR